MEWFQTHIWVLWAAVALMTLGVLNVLIEERH